ncbi:MAG: protein-glutamate O-methyltransferase CheR [Actinobacteria bacterium]|nr:protein-glutamate O-methyltransferase CheR [Actinomycetota bacterium]
MEADTELWQAADDLEEIEIDLLLEGIWRRYGLDFSDYAKSSLRRRIRHMAATEAVPNVSALSERILHDPATMQRLKSEFSISVGAMFRDPPFFRAFREIVVPILRTYPNVRIWDVGCGSGEEVFSLSILLHEEGLVDRTRIYATDFNRAALEQARTAMLPLAKMKDYTANYRESGGTKEFSSYYVAKYDRAAFKPNLVDCVTFAEHNLVTDGQFNEFEVVICRNVMIYFNHQLRTRVHRLLFKSLVPFGVLALGDAESLRNVEFASSYERLHPTVQLYRRMH